MIDFSVITVVRNAVGTIRNCIESVHNQAYQTEHIIIDGGSTDGTLEIMDKYHSDSIRIVSEPDRGIYDAMNRGIRLAHGDVISLLNADDFYTDSDILATVAHEFEYTNVESCYGDLVYVDSENLNRVTRYWRSGQCSIRRLHWGWMPPHPTFFVRRFVYEKYGCFNLDLGSAADYELMLRFLLKNKVSTTYIPRILVAMRSGGISNASLENRLHANRMDRKAWQINGLRPYPWTLLLKPLGKMGQYLRRPRDYRLSDNVFGRDRGNLSE